MSLDSIQALRATENLDPNAGKSKLVSPDPLRRKFIAEMLLAFSKRQVTLADLIELAPAKLKHLAEMGFVKLKHGRLDEARKIFELLVFLDHKSFFYQISLAASLQKSKKVVEAIYRYGEAVKLKPNSTNALVNRGELYLRMRNYRKAAEDFRAAILLDSHGVDRYANRARSLVVAIRRGLEKNKTSDRPRIGRHALN
jgi:tetratricopeptide (TPR) repeat protein